MQARHRSTGDAWHGAQVAHQLSGGFRDECALEAELSAYVTP